MVVAVVDLAAASTLQVTEKAESVLIGPHAGDCGPGQLEVLRQRPSR